MAYVTLEDDTGSIECLAFSNMIRQYGSFLKEGLAVVLHGRISIREEKEPQLVLNSAEPIRTDQLATALPEEKSKKLYLRLPSEQSPSYRKTCAILNMFPGNMPVVLYFADSGLRRGTTCSPQDNMLRELSRLLEAENVVLK